MYWSFVEIAIFFFLILDVSCHEVLYIDPDQYVLWHNAYRCLHNSPPVVWSQTLADSALVWTQTCDGLDTPNGIYGENLWNDALYLGTAQQVIAAWYDEINIYNWATRGFQMAGAHFTLLVWGSVRAIGCAACRNSDNHNYYVVCEYSPCGNGPGFPANVLPVAKTQEMCFPTPSPANCIDYPVDWADYYNISCSGYAANHWCENGGIGTAWPHPSFEGYQDTKYGLNANQVCCECGGGARPSPSPLSPSPSQSPVSQSKSSSPSPSPSTSRSPSMPPSMSRSPSPSRSLSPATSPTPSPSTSEEPSESPSASESPSSSPSDSQSPNPSYSLSPSPASVSPRTCIDKDDGWMDYFNQSCQYYEDHQFCVNDTQSNEWPYPNGWTIAQSYSESGGDAFEMCCICGGGLQLSPVPSESPEPSPSGSPSQQPSPSGSPPPTPRPSSSTSPSPLVSGSPIPVANVSHPGPTTINIIKQSVSIWNGDARRAKKYGTRIIPALDHVTGLSAAQRLGLVRSLTISETYIYNDGVVSYIDAHDVQQFNVTFADQSSRLRVRSWGSDVAFVVLASYTVKFDALMKLGIPNFRLGFTLDLLVQVDRLGADGSLMNGSPMEFELTAPTTGGAKPSACLYSSSFPAIQSLPATQWKAIGPQTWLLTVPHTSVLAVYSAAGNLQRDVLIPSASPEVSPPKPASSLWPLWELALLPLIGVTFAIAIQRFCCQKGGDTVVVQPITDSHGCDAAQKLDPIHTDQSPMSSEVDGGEEHDVVIDVPVQVHPVGPYLRYQSTASESSKVAKLDRGISVESCALEPPVDGMTGVVREVLVLGDGAMDHFQAPDLRIDSSTLDPMHLNSTRSTDLQSDGSPKVPQGVSFKKPLELPLNGESQVSPCRSPGRQRCGALSRIVTADFINHLSEYTFGRPVSRDSLAPISHSVDASPMDSPLHAGSRKESFGSGCSSVLRKDLRVNFQALPSTADFVRDESISTSHAVSPRRSPTRTTGMPEYPLQSA